MPTPEQLASLISVAPSTRIEVMGRDGMQTIEAVTITRDLQGAIYRALMRTEKEEVA